MSDTAHSGTHIRCGPVGRRRDQCFHRLEAPKTGTMPMPSRCPLPGQHRLRENCVGLYEAAALGAAAHFGETNANERDDEHAARVFGQR